METQLDYSYNPAFYRKDVESQIKILTDTVNSFNRRLYSNSSRDLNPSMALEYLYSGKINYDLPYGCHEHDGLFAIISPFGFKHILGWLGNEIFDSELNCKSLNFLFEIIKEKMPFINYEVVNPRVKNLMQTSSSLEGYSRISYFQGESHIWLINTQLGFLRRGESANIELYPNEFGLDPVLAWCIKLIHPELAFDTWNHLGISCIGSRFVHNNNVPNIFSNGSCECSGSHPAENTYSKFGNATFFV